MSARGRIAIAVLVAVSLAACALPRPRMLGPTDAERRAYESALAVARRDNTLGRARLAAFLDRYPDSSLADDASVVLARLELRAKRPKEAEKRLRTVLREHGREDRADAARLELAKILAKRGDVDGAFEIASEIKLSLLRDAERRDAYRLLADLARDRDDPAARLEWLAKLRGAEKPGDAVVAVDQEIDATLAAMPADELVRTAERLGRRIPATRVWLRAADLSLRGGDVASASRALAQAEKLPLQPAEAEQLVRLQTALEGRSSGAADATTPPPLGSVDPGSLSQLPLPAEGAIGVVLPLSGPLARVSEDVLRGVLLATGAFPADPAAASGLRVLVRDSGGNPQRAADAVRELGQRGDVSAVVGPLTKEEVEAAGAAAQEVGLPLLSLTRHESVARDRAEVIRFGLTRRMEVEVLADHAVGQLGLTRFAILYPKDEYGREFESLLWQAVESRGARVVAVAGYAPRATDFAAPLRQLLGPVDQPSLAAGAAETPPPPPVLDFDALFIPDAHDKVGLIALQLAAGQIQGARLFGPSGWHHPDLLRVAGPLVDGAFFSSGFDPSNPSSLIQEFVARYQGAYGAAPTPFAAQGFDAATLVGRQLANGAETPADVRSGLVATELYPGVSGVTSIGPDGDARKRPFLLEVREGAMRSIE